MTLKLRRLILNHKGTFGVLSTIEDGFEIPFCVTLERPSATPLEINAPMTAIPEGTYKCKPFFSPSMKIWTFEITNVPNRTVILFHGGNDIDDTEGCVLIGLRYFNNGIANCEDAMKILSAKAFGLKEFDLTIYDPK